MLAQAFLLQLLLLAIRPPRRLPSAFPRHLLFSAINSNALRTAHLRHLRAFFLASHLPRLAHNSMHATRRATTGYARRAAAGEVGTTKHVGATLGRGATYGATGPYL